MSTVSEENYVSNSRFSTLKTWGCVPLKICAFAVFSDPFAKVCKH